MNVIICCAVPVIIQMQIVVFAMTPFVHTVKKRKRRPNGHRLYFLYYSSALYSAQTFCVTASGACS